MAVDLSDLVPGILATVTSAAIIALVAFMMPAVRWSRQLSREVAILGGLPQGPERDAWEKRILEHARRLRLFQDQMPYRHKVLPWMPVFLFIGAVTLAIVDPRQVEGIIAEGPIMIPLILIALLNVGLFIVTGVLGVSTSGKSAEDFARERGSLADEM